MITAQKLFGAPVVGEMKCNFSPDRVFSPRECCGCSEKYYCETRFKIKVYADLGREDRIETLIRDIHELNIEKSIEQRDFKAVLEEMVKFDIAGIEREFQKRQVQNKPLILDTDLPHTENKKIVLDSNVADLGEIIGKFVFGTKNIKGNHLFKTDCVTLAKCICDCCLTVDATPFKLTTLLKYLGKGRKLAIEEEKILKKMAEN